MRFFTPLVLFWSLCSILPIYAQSDAPQGGRNLRIGLGLTNIGYVGDLSESSRLFNRFYPGGNISFQLSHEKPGHFQFNVGFGAFTEQWDSETPLIGPPGVDINTFVRTSLFYGDARYKYRFETNSFVRPFVSAGLGVLVFSPKDANGKFLSNAFGTREEGEEYNTAVFQLPLTAGVSFRISPNVSTTIDYTYRMVPTDYLDNIGNLGTRNGNDMLHGFQVALNISLGKKPTQGFNKDEMRPVGPEVVYNTGTEAETGTKGNGYAKEEDLYIQDIFANEENGTEKEEIPFEGGDIEELLTGRSEKKPDAFPNEAVPVASKLGPMTEAELDLYALETEDVFYYKVKRGDTFQSLYQKFKVKPYILKQVNAYSSNTPPVGKYMRFPDLRPWYQNKLVIQEEVKRDLEGSSFDSARTNTSVVPTDASLDSRINQAINDQSFQYHKVRKGETLDSISKLYGVPVKYIRQVNFLGDEKVSKGNRLRIPSIK